MSNAINGLGKTALEAAKAMFLAVFSRPLNTNFVNFQLDASSGELIVSARDESDSGEVGIYRGVFRWPYNKVSLNTVCPNPLVVEVEYPLTFRQLRAQLLARYDFVLEENEVALTNGGVGLMDDNHLATPLMNEYGQFRLYATGASGRFVAGTYLSLIFIQPNSRVPLRALLDFRSQGALGVLAAR